MPKYSWCIVGRRVASFSLSTSPRPTTTLRGGRRFVCVRWPCRVPEWRTHSDCTEKGECSARCFCGQIRAVVNGVWIFRYSSGNDGPGRRKAHRAPPPATGTAVISPNSNAHCSPLLLLLLLLKRGREKSPFHPGRREQRYTHLPVPYLRGSIGLYIKFWRHHDPPALR